MPWNNFFGSKVQKIFKETQMALLFALLTYIYKKQADIYQTANFYNLQKPYS